MAHIIRLPLRIVNACFLYENDIKRNCLQLPRLLHSELSYAKMITKLQRILFLDVPRKGGTRMLFQENTYSVLLVSVSRKTISETLPLLPATDYYPVVSARSVSEAKRMLIDESFDLVIINSPLPDDAGLQFATDLCVNSDAGVMLMVPKDLYEDTCSKVLPFGVVALSIPTSTQMVSHSLRVLCSIRERLRSVKTRQKTVEEKMEELRLVNRAKLLLIQCLNMTEAEAHRHIQQQAMERQLSKREVAVNIIRTYQ